MAKLITLKKAISEFVQDGDVVYAAGFTHLIPFAAGHEIIRQGKKNLTLSIDQNNAYTVSVSRFINHVVLPIITI